MPEPIVSIVIAAYNEEAVIAANLRRLLDTTLPGEFDIVVVPNGCSDGTAAAAREIGVRVIETEVAGKVNALAIGDAACRTFPRIYLDADVVLDAAAVRALVKACAQPGVLACAPVPRLDTDGVGWLARRVHRVHEQLIAPGRALAGVGVYVLTESGHAKVFPMPPEVISDDGWVHGSFASHERVVVTQAHSVVRPARTVRAHLRRRVRVRLGNRQLAELGRAAPEGRLGARSLVSLVTGRRVGAFDALCYVCVLAADRVMVRARRGHGVSWGSDLSTRSARGAGTTGSAGPDGA